MYEDYKNIIIVHLMKIIIVMSINTNSIRIRKTKRREKSLEIPQFPRYFDSFKITKHCTVGF